VLPTNSFLTNPDGWKTCPITSAPTTFSSEFALETVTTIACLFPRLTGFLEISIETDNGLLALSMLLAFCFTVDISPLSKAPPFSVVVVVVGLVGVVVVVGLVGVVVVVVGLVGVVVVVVGLVGVVVVVVVVGLVGVVVVVVGLVGVVGVVGVVGLVGVVGVVVVVGLVGVVVVVVVGLVGAAATDDDGNVLEEIGAVTFFGFTVDAVVVVGLVGAAATDDEDKSTCC
jgi:hypothetical protein